MLNVSSFENDDKLVGLAYYLCRDGLLSSHDAKKAVRASQQENLSLSQFLVKSRYLSSESILNYCANTFNLTIFDLATYNFSWLENAVIKPELACRYRIIPLHRDQSTLHIAIADPTDHASSSAISFQTGLRIQKMLVGESELDHFIQNHIRPLLLSAQLESALSKITPHEEMMTPPIVAEYDDEPVIDFVDHLLCDAIEKHVSDIHIESYESHCRVRFRHDGLLYEATSLPSHLMSRIITRLKIMANLNIAERRLPQDGRLYFQHKTQDHKIDIRINTCPTLFGEKMVLRLLDVKNIKLDLASLGLTDEQKNLFLHQLSQPQGLILVTGPTGSGKTISLYSALHYLNRIEKNISSAEDPVEIELKGINQVQVNSKIGLNFATLLRTFLRQDPDIIMIGEIRDSETATIAIQAAQTGHLVLSTLHTNSAIEAISRLKSMDISAYHLTHALTLIIAQRLVRKLCDLCKQPIALPAHLRSQFSEPVPTIIFGAVGCEYCHQGYQGRIGIFECISMNDHLSLALTTSSSIDKTKWMSLWQAGLEKVKQGVTSLAEIIRIVGQA